ncbi:MAG: polysulfide reductase NrfD [Armatimonadetes bacterium]|nr:polysulfide reductase NrfD [Armatimonadota bacterium]
MSTITNTLSLQTKKAAIWPKIMWLVLFIIGSIAVVQRFTQGHLLTNYGSYVPWGLWVSAYMWLVGLSAGAFLFSSLHYVFGVERLERVSKFALLTALVTLICALVAILFDLGQMWRFYRIFTSPNFSSMMTWMVWLYTAYAILLVSELYLVLKKPNEKRKIRIIASVGLPLAVAFSGGAGALFSTVAARPTWHSPMMPILFLTGALVSGGGLLLLIVGLYGKIEAETRRKIAMYIAKLVAGFLIFDLLLEWAEFSIPMWYGVGHEFEALRMVLFGQFWWVFWVVHLLIGSLIPLYILLRSKSTKALAFAGSLIAVTFMAVRLNIVIPAFMTPELEGLQNSFTGDRLQFAYVPSLHEWQVLLFIVCAGFAMFYVGSRVLGNNAGDGQASDLIYEEK